MTKFFHTFPDSVGTLLFFVAQHTATTHTNAAIQLQVISKRGIRSHSALYEIFIFLFYLILEPAIGGRPKPKLCFLPGRLRWTLLPKERYGDSLSGRGSNTQPSNWDVESLHWAIVDHISFHQSEWYVWHTFWALPRC